MEASLSVVLMNQTDAGERAEALAWLIGTEDYAGKPPAAQNVLLPRPVPRVDMPAHMPLREAAAILRANAHVSDDVFRRALAVNSEYERRYNLAKLLPDRGGFAGACAQKLQAAHSHDRRRVLLLRGRLHQLQEHGADGGAAATLQRQLETYQREDGHLPSVDDVARLAVVQHFARLYCTRTMKFAHFRQMDLSQFTIGRVLNNHLHVFSNVVLVCLGCQGQQRAGSGITKEEAALRRVLQLSGATPEAVEDAFLLTVAGLYDVNPVVQIAGGELGGVLVEGVLDAVDKHVRGAELHKAHDDFRPFQMSNGQLAECGPLSNSNESQLRLTTSVIRCARCRSAGVSVSAGKHVGCGGAIVRVCSICGFRASGHSTELNVCPRILEWSAIPRKSRPALAETILARIRAAALADEVLSAAVPPNLHVRDALRDAAATADEAKEEWWQEPALTTTLMATLARLRTNAQATSLLAVPGGIPN